MLEKIGRTVLLLLICSLLVGANSHGSPRRVKKPSERMFEIQPSRFIVVPRLHFGYLLYDTPDEYPSDAGSRANRLLIAAAATIEYYVRDHWALQAAIERGWKDRPGDAPTITSWALGTGVQYLLWPAAKRSPFLRVEAGKIWGRSESMDKVDYVYYRLGIGLFEYTTPTTTLRIEPFYRRILNEGKEPLWIDYDIDYLGLDLAVGFGL